MKIVKKLAAILAAAVLCMGMGTSALAAQDGSDDLFWSPDALKKLSEAEVQSVTAADGTKLEYTERDLSEGTMQTLSDGSKVKKIFESAGFGVSDDMYFVPIYMSHITWDGGGAAVVAFSASSGTVGSESFQPGNAIYALRETYSGSGVFEAYAGEVDANGEVRFNLAGSSSLILVKILSDGSVVTLDKKTGLTVDSDVQGNDDNKVTVTNATRKDADGNDIEAGVRVSELESDIEQLINDNFEAIFEAQYNYPGNSDIELVYKGEFYRTDDETGTVRMYFAVEDENENTYYYALHGITNANGEVESWEILECRKDDETGDMYFELDSFSPVAIIRVMSDQTPVLRPTKPSKPVSGGSSSSTKKPGSTTQQEVTTQLGAAGQSGTTVQIGSSEKTSPKTGEF